jgi:hypothetical protein
MNKKPKVSYNPLSISDSLGILHWWLSAGTITAEGTEGESVNI